MNGHVIINNLDFSTYQVIIEAQGHIKTRIFLPFSQNYLEKVLFIALQGLISFKEISLIFFLASTDTYEYSTQPFTGHVTLTTKNRLPNANSADIFVSPSVIDLIPIAIGSTTSFFLNISNIGIYLFIILF